MTRHNFIHRNRLPCAFTTGSCAEYHWQELFRVLEIVFIKRKDIDSAAAVHDLANGRECPAQFKNKLYSILKDELVIINELFQIKTRAWFKLVYLVH